MKKYLIVFFICILFSIKGFSQQVFSALQWNKSERSAPAESIENLKRTKLEVKEARQKYKSIKNSKNLTINEIANSKNEIITAKENRKKAKLELAEEDTVSRVHISGDGGTDALNLDKVSAAGGLNMLVDLTSFVTRQSVPPTPKV